MPRNAGHEEDFHIEAIVRLHVIDSGTEDLDGDHFWNDDSDCMCGNRDCDQQGPLREFRIENQTAIRRVFIPKANGKLRLGKSGLRVSELALGAMSFGTEWGWGTEKNEARTMLDLYIDNGGNFVDTANVYTNGSSEKILGECLGEKRQQIVLSTKYTMNTHPGDPNGGGNHRRVWFVPLKQVFKDSRLITSTCSTCTSGMIRHPSKKFCERWMTLCARERFSTWECRILRRGKSRECKPLPIFADGLRSSRFK